METSSQNQNRLHYLDAARAFALLLGIVFHASLSFVPIYIGWAVMDVSTSPIVSQFLLISHSFRMELFFLVAGFFSHMTFHSKGARNFLKSRFVRIAIPFVIGWFVMRPLLVSGWIMGAESMRGDANILAAIQSGFATLDQLPSGLFTGTHLWFLYYLLLITSGILVLRYFIGIHKSVQLNVSQFADASVRWLASSRFAILVAAAPIAACLWFMNHWGMDTPDKTLSPHTPVLLIYGGFYLLGWLMQRQAPWIEQFSRLAWSKLTLCVLAIVATSLLASFESTPHHAQYTLIKIGFVCSYAIMMYSLVSITLGLFNHLFRRPSRVVRYIADASYWLYLIHLPIVIWLQIAFAELPIHWSFKLAAISTITVLVSLVLYDLCVRATFVGTVLNGKRKPRVLLPLDKMPKSLQVPPVRVD